jgi:hypothetical protein
MLLVAQQPQKHISSVKEIYRSSPSLTACAGAASVVALDVLLFFDSFYSFAPPLCPSLTTFL